MDDLAAVEPEKMVGGANTELVTSDPASSLACILHRAETIAIYFRSPQLVMHKIYISNPPPPPPHQIKIKTEISQSTVGQ